MRQHEAREGWDYYDVHGVAGVWVESDAPGAAQLREMLACFRVSEAPKQDVVVTSRTDDTSLDARLEDDLRYGPDRVEFVREGVQVVRGADGYRVQGDGELLTAVVPVLDRVCVERGAAMIHAATVGWRGRAVALPAAGGTGKTSTIAKLTRRPGFSFMGDDWAFLGADGRLLGYEKPMFIKPHHRDIYPHMFKGVRKPMVPVRWSRPLGRLTTVVHPMVVRYPRLAALARRWSPEHRTVSAATALPGVAVTDDAPLALCVYVERHGGGETAVVPVDADWMADRMLGNFFVEMASFSREIVTGLAATSVLPWKEYADDKFAVLRSGLEGVPCYLLQVPAAFTPDRASDQVVEALEALLPTPAATP